MPSYELADAAVEDLKSIDLYTVSKWGPKQAARPDIHGAALHSGRAAKIQGGGGCFIGACIAAARMAPQMILLVHRYEGRG